MVCYVGCVDPTQTESNRNNAAEPDSKENSGIFGKRTQEIGEFDSKSGAKVSDGTMEPAHPLNPLGALKAYGPTLEKISKMYIEQAINLFHAEHGRYPKDHDEFMELIIKANDIQLPVLPGKAQYQYDVENHELVIIEPDNEQTEN
jgi:hypothetical protein